MDLAGRIRRWLYRGKRANSLARLLNNAQAQLAARGIGPGWVVVLEVPGRRTGRTIALPVVVADVQGERYLVSMLGENASWVRNVRAAGGRAVLRHGRRETVQLQEVEPTRRAPILRRYLQRAPGARAHIPVDRRAPLERFEQVATRYPVFRIVTAGDEAEDTRAGAGDGRAGTCGERRQVTFDLAARVRRPQQAVYGLLADIQQAEPIPRRAKVEMIKDPPGVTTVGTRWHERIRLAPGCWLRVESVVTEADAPRCLGMDFRSRWFTGHLTYEIEPTADGSVLHHRETLLPRAPLRPFGPFLGRRLRPRLRQRLADIKNLLER